MHGIATRGQYKKRLNLNGQISSLVSWTFRRHYTQFLVWTKHPHQQTSLERFFFFKKFLTFHVVTLNHLQVYRFENRYNDVLHTVLHLKFKPFLTVVTVMYTLQPVGGDNTEDATVLLSDVTTQEGWLGIHKSLNVVVPKVRGESPSEAICINTT